ncbi:MAG: LPS assembly lipoprotein LptE [Halioglobus sp.]
MPQTLFKTCAVLAITLLLSACGFQLRGTGDFSKLLPEDWKSLSLNSANGNSEFSREIESRFAANGVQWGERGETNFTLMVQAEKFEQDNLSLSSEARAAEYELTMSTKFTVLDANNQVAMEETRVGVVKQMENDPRNVVGKEEEIRLLRREMRTELAQQILRRMSFYASRTQAPDEALAPTGSEAPTAP